MQDYKIRVTSSSSEIIQKMCFKMGIVWESDGAVALFVDSPVLYITNNQLTYGHNNHYFNTHPNTQMVASDWIELYKNGDPDNYSGGTDIHSMVSNTTRFDTNTQHIYEDTTSAISSIKFKVGDIVKYSEEYKSVVWASERDERGEVISIEGSGDLYIVWQDGDTYSTSLVSDLTILELVKSTKNIKYKRRDMSLQTPTVRQKKSIPKNLLPVFEAGWIDNSLQLTSSGKNAMLGFVLDNNEKEIAKLATEEIVRVKEKKKND